MRERARLLWLAGVAWAAVGFLGSVAFGDAARHADRTQYRGEDAPGRTVIDERAAAACGDAVRQMSLGNARSVLKVGRNVPDGIQLSAVEASGYPYIYSYLSIYKDNTPVTNLPASAFAVFEEYGGQWVPQVKHLSVTPPQQGGSIRAVDFVFLIDDSGSMQPYINEVRDNVRDFADSMTKAGIDVQLGLVRFGQSGSGSPIIFNEGELTADVSTFKSWLDQFRATGGTEPSVQAVIEAARGFPFRSVSQRHFLVITDEDSDGGDLSEAISLSQLQNISVHCAVNAGAGGNSQQVYLDDHTSMRGATGGLLFGVRDPYDALLQEIENVVSDSYIVKYYSTEPNADCRMQPGKIVVSAHTISGEVTYDYLAGGTPQIALSEQTLFKRSRGVLPNRATDVTVVVTDCVEPFVADVTLYVRTIGASGDFNAFMCSNTAGDVWAASIPASIVGDHGFEFYCTATDETKSVSMPSEQPEANALVIRTTSTNGFVHFSPELVPPGQEADLEVLQLPGAPRSLGITLHYRPPGGAAWTEVVLASAGSAVPYTEAIWSGTIPATAVGADGIEYYFAIELDVGRTRLPIDASSVYRIRPLANWALVEELRAFHQASTGHLEFVAGQAADALGAFVYSQQVGAEDVAWEVAAWTAFAANMVVGGLKDPAKLNHAPPTNVKPGTFNWLVNRSHLGMLRDMSQTVHASRLETLLRAHDFASFVTQSLGLNPAKWNISRKWLGELIWTAGQHDFPSEADAKDWFQQKLLNEMPYEDMDGVAHYNGIGGVIATLDDGFPAVEARYAAVPMGPGMSEAIAYLRYQRRALEHSRRTFMSTFLYNDAEGRLSPELEFGATQNASEKTRDAILALENNEAVSRTSTVATLGLVGLKIAGHFASAGVTVVIQGAYWAGNIATTGAGLVNAATRMSNETELGVALQMTGEAMLTETVSTGVLVGDVYARGLDAVLAAPSIAPLAHDLSISITDFDTRDLHCPAITTASVCPLELTASLVVQNSDPNSAASSVPVTAVIKLLHADQQWFGLAPPKIGAPLDFTSDSEWLGSGDAVKLSMSKVYVAGAIPSAVVSGIVYAGVVPYLPTATQYTTEEEALRAIAVDLITVRDLTGNALGLLAAGQTFSIQYVPPTNLVDVVMDFPGSNFDLHVYDDSGTHSGMDYESGAYVNEVSGVALGDTEGTTRVIRISGRQGDPLTLQVYAHQADQPEPFRLIAREIADDLPAVVAVSPELVGVNWDLFDQEEAGERVFEGAFMVQEVGGQNDADIAIVASDLTNEDVGHTIPADALSFDVVESTVRAGSEAEVLYTLIVPEQGLRYGKYACEVTVAGPNNDATFLMTLDVVDLCPEDPNKVEPGICGCGVSDVDTDGDGVADCEDECLEDPNKVTSGACGCGVPDTDTDGDDVPDCEDRCADDPNKSSPGECGCGFSDEDSDGDGVPDCLDNCVNVPNADQSDSNGDGVGDDCDGAEREQTDDIDVDVEEATVPTSAGCCPSVGSLLMTLTILGIVRSRRCRIGW